MMAVEATALSASDYMQMVKELLQMASECLENARVLLSEEASQ